MALGGLTGLGANLAPTLAGAAGLRIKNAKTVPSICPYCSVGLVHTVDGKIVNVEGDPRSPFNEGTLCPKGAAIYQLHVNPNRPTKVLHRAPGATEWELLGEWRLACLAGDFADWLDRGAPSDDTGAGRPPLAPGRLRLRGSAPE